MLNVVFNENGWTTVQEASKDRHIVQISCYAENGIIKEIRKCHQDGEEEKIKGAIDQTHSLPMPIKELAKVFHEIKW